MAFIQFQERMRKEGEKQAEYQQAQADRELTHASWEDVKAYRLKERELQRQSLAWRIADAHRKHEVDLTLHQEALNRMHQDLELRRMDWLAVQEYKKSEQDRKRKSIALRLDSWRQQRMAEEKPKATLDLIAEQDALLKEMDREELIAAKLANDLIEKNNSQNSSLLL